MTTTPKPSGTKRTPVPRLVSVADAARRLARDPKSVRVFLSNRGVTPDSEGRVPWSTVAKLYKQHEASKAKPAGAADLPAKRGLKLDEEVKRLRLVNAQLAGDLVDAGEVKAYVEALVALLVSGLTELDATLAAALPTREAVVAMQSALDQTRNALADRVAAMPDDLLKRAAREAAARIGSEQPSTEPSGEPGADAET